LEKAKRVGATEDPSARALALRAAAHTMPTRTADFDANFTKNPR
jgi:hypothetical protein